MSKFLDLAEFNALPNDAVQVELTKADGHVFVRSCSGAAMDRVLAMIEKGDRATGFAHLIRDCVCDAQGSQVFGDKDIEKIKAMPYALFMELVQACQQCNGITKEEAKVIEGKSEPITGDASGSP